MKEKIEKIEKFKRELFRKSIHIFFGLFFILLSIYYQLEIILITSSLLTFLAILNKFYFQKFKTIYRQNNFSMGTILYPFSIGLLAWIWLPNFLEVFIFAVLILTFSDSLASLIGIWDKKKLPYFQKTWSGSLTFFISTFIISLLLYKKIDILPIIYTSLILTIIEFFFIYGLDNLALTLAASYLFYYFNF